jgi:hypothetical protein
VKKWRAFVTRPLKPKAGAARRGHEKVFCELSISWGFVRRIGSGKVQPVESGRADGTESETNKEKQRCDS